MLTWEWNSQPHDRGAHISQSRKKLLFLGKQYIVGAGRRGMALAGTWGLVSAPSRPPPAHPAKTGRDGREQTFWWTCQVSPRPSRKNGARRAGTNVLVDLPGIAPSVPPLRHWWGTAFWRAEARRDRNSNTRLAARMEVMSAWS